MPGEERPQSPIPRFKYWKARLPTNPRFPTTLCHQPRQINPELKGAGEGKKPRAEVLVPFSDYQTKGIGPDTAKP